MRTSGWILVVLLVGCAALRGNDPGSDDFYARWHADAMKPDATLDDALRFANAAPDLERRIRDKKFPASWLDDAWAALDRTEAAKEVSQYDKRKVAQARGLVLTAKGVEKGPNDRTPASYYLECIELDPLYDLRSDTAGVCFDNLEPADQLLACGNLRFALYHWDKSNEALVTNFEWMMKLCIESARKITKGAVTGDDLGWAAADKDLEVYEKLIAGGFDQPIPAKPDTSEKPGKPEKPKGYTGKKEGVMCFKSKECQPGLSCVTEGRSRIAHCRR